MMTIHLPTSSLALSLQRCRQRTRRAGSNLTLAFSLLPPMKRQAMEVLYAVMRYTDDLADDPAYGDGDNRLRLLDAWYNAVLASLAPTIAGAGDTDGFARLAMQFPALSDGVAILPAVRWMVDAFNVPRESILFVIEGAMSDTRPQRFRTFDEAAAYCHLVATAVGYASLSIWGTHIDRTSTELMRAAKACGLAFQWTNIVRDQVEDARAGRLYLPTKEIAHCGLSEDELLAWLVSPAPSSRDGVVYEKWLRLMSRQLERCSHFFEQSASLTPMIHADARPLFVAMRSVYKTIFETMLHDPARILRGRVRPTFWGTLRILGYCASQAVYARIAGRRNKP